MKQKWMTVEILKKIEDRSTDNTKKIKELNRGIQKAYYEKR